MATTLGLLRRTLRSASVILAGITAACSATPPVDGSASAAHIPGCATDRGQATQRAHWLTTIESIPTVGEGDCSVSGAEKFTHLISLGAEASTASKESEPNPSREECEALRASIDTPDIWQKLILDAKAQAENNARSVCKNNCGASANRTIDAKECEEATVRANEAACKAKCDEVIFNQKDGDPSGGNPYAGLRHNESELDKHWAPDGEYTGKCVDHFDYMTNSWDGPTEVKAQ